MHALLQSFLRYTQMLNVYVYSNFRFNELYVPQQRLQSMFKFGKIFPKSLKS